ncbi:hypothetical protein ABW20_dc0107001 [Dactylellina cionopaga]|nr:hypothetical protein ABW20_dc0107001 [Dactylellina cionopaga]
MTFREKVKSLLHHSHKKSVPTGSTTGKTSPTSTGAKPDPNKPPNARDPGFRKSFNLGDPSTSNSPEEIEPKGTSPSGSINIPTNGKDRMQTLDKYGEDYLAVSPRTNVTVPDGTGQNRGLSPVAPLDEETKTSALGPIPENKHDDPVAAAARALDELRTSQQEPNPGREQLANGDRKADSGFVEPVPTRDATVASPSQDTKPAHPTTFALESSPAPLSQEPSEPTTLPSSSNIQPLDPKPDTLLPPHIPIEDAASSIYSDDSTRPPLQQIASSVYSQPAFSPPLNDYALPTATDHQQQYTSLVSDVLPNAEAEKNAAEEPITIDENSDLLTVIRSKLGESHKAGEISPSILPADEPNVWSQGLIADLGKVNVRTPEPVQDESIVDSKRSAENATFVPDTALMNPGASIDQQAEAFANIIMAHAEPTKTGTKAVDSSLEKQAEAFADIIMAHTKSLQTTNGTADSRAGIPDALPQEQKPIVTTTNTVPHADAYHMGDLPDILAMEERTTAGANDVHNRETESAEDANKMQEKQTSNPEYGDLNSRPPLTHDDSVYAVTKAIPGAF